MHEVKTVAARRKKEIRLIVDECLIVALGLEVVGAILTEEIVLHPRWPAFPAVVEKSSRAREERREGLRLWRGDGG